MELKTYSPSNRLQKYVRQYWILKVNKKDCPLHYPVIPFGSFELLLNIKQSKILQWTTFGDVRPQPYAFYSGQFTKTIFLSFEEPVKTIGISFQPWAGNSLFGIPADKFANKSVKLELLNWDCSFYNRLVECDHDHTLVGFLNQFLEQQLLKKPIDSLIADITSRIITNPNQYSPSEHIDSLPYSRRRIEQRFRESTGLTMSTLIRKARFQKAIRMLQNDYVQNLTTIGLESGYYDQSHFIREFKLFTSQTPKSFVENCLPDKDISRLLMVE